MLSGFLDDLATMLGQHAIVRDRDRIAPWEVDWRGRFHGQAQALLQPASVAEVQTIVRAAARHRVPLVPQGGNTSMVGGATPPADGRTAILSLRRLDRVRRLDAEAGLAVAEAGVILAVLDDAARHAGRRFPLTLGARGSATIGGLVSTNAGGTQVLRFGTMRRLVLGLEAVLADGSLHNGLAPLAKDNRGPSIDQLLIGAEGTLGVVTAATLRLVPAAARATAWLGLRSPVAALRVLRRLEARTDALESFEILPAGSLGAALQYLGDGTMAPIDATHEWHALVEVTGADAAAAAALLEGALAEALEGGDIDDAVLAASEAQAERFWRLRDSLSAAERALGPAAQHDISVPVDAMAGFMTELARACEERFPGTRASGFGHLGDGNIHFHVRAPAGADPAAWYANEAPAISRYVHDRVAAAGGSIAAEHGIGQMKLNEFARLCPERAATLRAIKAALDPFGILNPGKLVTLAPVSAAA